MLTVAVITTDIPNQPPTIQNTSFALLEDQDGGYSFSISYVDEEDDKLKFRAAARPQHGAVTVSEDGRLQYIPDPNFSGIDIIYIVGERSLSTG